MKFAICMFVIEMLAGPVVAASTTNPSTRPAHVRSTVDILFETEYRAAKKLAPATQPAALNSALLRSDLDPADDKIRSLAWTYVQTKHASDWINHLQTRVSDGSILPDERALWMLVRAYTEEIAH